LPNWSEILKQIQTVQLSEQKEVSIHEAKTANAVNIVRHEYLAKLHQRTGRNVIAYYSGFLSKPGIHGLEISDEDKNGFMMAVHKLDRSKGLDLILHTPGGGLTSTQSIVDYLHRMFRTSRDAIPDIRAIIPQIAMSAGTMIACSCKEIWMGKHSNLGPIDPQFNGIPAYGVLKEFQTACREVKSQPTKIPIWQSIISQYRPTYLSRCKNAIDLSNAFVAKQLETVMFNGLTNAKTKAKQVVKALTHYTQNKAHDRHIHIDECAAMGLVVKSIEDSGEYTNEVDEKGDFQDLILTVHHCYMHFLMNTPAFKVIENHLGTGISKQQLSQK
jgi:ClpP class serine protease